VDLALTLNRKAHVFLFQLMSLLAGSNVLYSQVATPPGYPLVGLWGTEQSFGPLVRGTLTIDARQVQWRAAIAGFEVSVERNGDRLTFSLPNGVGEFRGRLDATSNAINGQWIQPVGVVNNNRYATPVRLVAVSRSIWTGEVVPLDDHVSFYVSIRSHRGGSNAAIIINPEFNLFRRRSYNVTLNGHGRLVLEEYFHGFDKERPHDMRSASKTFAPVLAGIARDHGVNLSPGTPIYPLFPEDKPFPHWDTRKSDVTLKALMTMTSGFACDDNDDTSPGNEGNMQSQTAQPDWYKYTLDLPMAAEPGGRHAVYCSADLNLVGGAVAHAAHSWLPEFFDRYLARPLQFGVYHMNLMPTGEAYMGGGLYLRPRDELKLGQLYLSGGIWHATRIVSEGWVRQSTSVYSTFDPQTNYDAPHEYGFGWHINRLQAGDRIFRAYSAGGNGGQIVMVIPELDLVVGVNGGSYGEFTKWYRWGLQLIPQYIIPAVS
jgi:CubicO group peptidase (beta-lactamase class C family)